MTSTCDITSVWFHEAVSCGMPHPDKQGWFLWNWPIQVEIDATVEYCQARAISDSGLEFEVRQDLSPGSKVRVRRQPSSCEEWVPFRTDASQPTPGDTFIVEGTFAV